MRCRNAVSRSLKVMRPQQRHHQQQLAEVLEVQRVEVASSGGTKRRHRDDQRGDAAENRAGDEMRPEDGRVPHGTGAIEKSNETIAPRPPPG
jgi:hypothetical protein